MSLTGKPGKERRFRKVPRGDLGSFSQKEGKSTRIAAELIFPCLEEDSPHRLKTGGKLLGQGGGRGVNPYLRRAYNVF